MTGPDTVRQAADLLEAGQIEQARALLRQALKALPDEENALPALPSPDGWQGRALNVARLWGQVEELTAKHAGAGAYRSYAWTVQRYRKQVQTLLDRLADWEDPHEAACLLFDWLESMARTDLHNDLPGLHDALHALLKSTYPVPPHGPRVVMLPVWRDLLDAASPLSWLACVRVDGVVYRAHMRPPDTTLYTDEDPLRGPWKLSPGFLEGSREVLPVLFPLDLRGQGQTGQRDGAAYRRGWIAAPLTAKGRRERGLVCAGGSMKPGDVLLCLSLEEQSQSEIHDRLTTRGHLVSPAVVRRFLDMLTADGLAVTKTQRRRFFYRLAEGEAVEAALDAAWAAS
ncbi:hypothetical protein [Deinococcus frigens]|uniref:hypothetical protein n=1 Tax=Deinococcus frigens TaxID=249403 RepID=UPI000495CC2A|nr:hypothetical protein [Deinococcus frigens]